MKKAILIFSLSILTLVSNAQTNFDKVGKVGKYKSDWAKVKLNGSYGFINHKEEVVVRPVFDKISSFGKYKEDWAKVKLNGSYGFINDKGEVVVEPVYDKISSFGKYKEDWAKVKLNGSYGFINHNGEIVVEPVYDKISYFGKYKEDWAKVKLNGSYGFINDKGEMIVEPVFDKISSFGKYKSDWAEVKLNGSYGFINDKGEMVVEPVLSSPKHYSQNQGEQYNLSKQFFKEQYKKQEYSKYDGTIKGNDSVFQYEENRFIGFADSNPEIKLMFEKGLLYPAVFDECGHTESVRGARHSKKKEEMNADTIEAAKQTLIMRICCLEELTYLSHTPTIKRFRLWLYTGINNLFTMNPAFYYFELTNETANEKTDTKTFIDSAKLTFIKCAGITV